MASGEFIDKSYIVSLKNVILCVVPQNIWKIIQQSKLTNIYIYINHSI